MCIVLLVYVVSLDGREVNETEKLFLMKWKAMRKARRNKSKTLMEAIPYHDSSSDAHIASVSHVLMSAPVYPFTLPALPVRLLPRKGKKPYQKHQYLTTTIPYQFPNSLDHYVDLCVRKKPEEVRLQEVASIQSLIADLGKLPTNLQGCYLPTAS